MSILALKKFILGGELILKQPKKANNQWLPGNNNN